MRIGFFNISFKQKNISREHNNKKKKDSSVKLSEFYKHRRNEVVSEPIDSRFTDRRTRYGIVMPTSYDDCYEKMSFENDFDNSDNSDIWRDNEYQEEFECPKHYDNIADLFNTPVSERYYFYKNYSYDDVPLSDSLIRSDHGFFETPHFDFDTDICEDSNRDIKFINFLENIVPSSLHCKPAPSHSTIYELANLAIMLRDCGYSTNSIIRALERCTIKQNMKGASYAEPKLFEFLVKQPNLRAEVVAKNTHLEERFDKNYANYFGILKEHYFDNEKDVRDALNLCRTKNNGFSLVNQDLCEIVGLMRRKSAQGIPVEDKNDDKYLDKNSKKTSIYCDRNLPLTQKDIELIKNIKRAGGAFLIKLDIAKSLLKNEGKTVDFVLSHIDEMAQEMLAKEDCLKVDNVQVEECATPKTEVSESTTQKIGAPDGTSTDKNVNLTKRMNDIRKFRYQLYKQYGDNVEKYIDSIETVLMEEVKYLNNNPDVRMEQSVFFEAANVLKEKNMSLAGISWVLTKLSQIGGYDYRKNEEMSRAGITPVNLDRQAIDKFIDTVSYTSSEGKLLVDKSLNALLGRLCLASGKASDVEFDIAKKVKTAQDYQLASLVEQMLDSKVPNKILLGNLDESLKYTQKYYEIMNNIRDDSGRHWYVFDFLRDELKLLYHKSNFSCENASGLKIAEKLLTNELSLPQVCSHLQALKFLEKHPNLKNKESIASRFQDIQKLNLKMLNKYGKNGSSHIDNIEAILIDELKYLALQSNDTFDKPVLFAVVNSLIEKNMALYSIYRLLNKFSNLAGYNEEKVKQMKLLGIEPVNIKLDLQCANKYIDAVSYISEQGSLQVDKTLNSLLSKLCFEAGKISDTEIETLNKINPYLTSKTVASKNIILPINNKQNVEVLEKTNLDQNEISQNEEIEKDKNIKKDVDGKHLQNIQNLKLKLIDKYGEIGLNRIEDIVDILMDEAKFMSSQSGAILDNTVLYEVVNNLIEKNMALYGIYCVLNKFSNLAGYDEEKVKQTKLLGIEPVYVKLDLPSAIKYADAVSYKSEQGALLVDKTLNSLLGKLCFASGKITDTEIAILNKTKRSVSVRYQCDGTKKSLVEEMLNFNISNDLILANMDEALRHKKVHGFFPWSFREFLYTELKKLCCQPNFSCENAPVWKIAQKVLAKEISLNDAYSAVGVR